MTERVAFVFPDTAASGTVSVVGYTRFGGAVKLAKAFCTDGLSASGITASFFAGAAGSETTIAAFSIHPTNNLQTVTGTWTLSDAVNIAAGSRLLVQVDSTGTANAGYSGLSVVVDLDSPTNPADLS